MNPSFMLAKNQDIEQGLYFPSIPKSPGSARCRSITRNALAKT